MSLISIITINYNNVNGLQKTFNSVFSQNSKYFEYIVIDGGSTDGSLDVIKNNEKKINFWISEKDRGIYDALNKGILNANGEYLLFLNSGDTFYDDTVIQQFLNLKHLHHLYGIIYGNVNLEYNNMSKILKQNTPLNLDFFYYHTLNHQSSFIKKTLFNAFGLYTVTYKISSDYEFFVKVFVNSPQEYYYTDYTMCNFDMSGLSQSPETQPEVVIERNDIKKKHFPKKYFKEKQRQHRQSIVYQIRDVCYKNKVTTFIYNSIKFIYRKIRY